MTDYILDECPTCDGDVFQKKTTYSHDFGFGILVVREVPVFVCHKCGSKWFAHDITVKLDKIIKEAKKRHNYIEVSKFDEVA